MRFILIVTGIAVAAGAQAQTEGSQPQLPQRVRSVAIAAGQKCPVPVGDEVVVCHTEDEPYRIPKQFRQLAPSAANQSWVGRAATLDEISRVAGGLPDTCSPVGAGGQTGCTMMMMRNWAAERREARREAESIP